MWMTLTQPLMPTLMSTYTHHEYLTHSAASFGVDRYEDNMFTVRDWQPLSFSSGNLIRGHGNTLHQDTAMCLANEPMTDDPRKEAVYVAVAATVGTKSTSFGWCEKPLSACALWKSGWMVISLKDFWWPPFLKRTPASDNILSRGILSQTLCEGSASTYQLIAIPNKHLSFFMITGIRTSVTIQIYKRCRHTHSPPFRHITCWLLMTHSKFQPFIVVVGIFGLFYKLPPEMHMQS
ncbi:predicted protein [Lichtheimia corymbifera JMRC:FSU:9682]|uniref:Uncharacterized protein n=1 Tax=Lichtheimia corymbifera JMRC:FSU:9682 TaxID=1263082 RepID=A0A068S8M8_9FUNG|nr:predicted protein [Lichtheimia corymbifera JMRC:FSU:9682]